MVHIDVRYHSSTWKLDGDTFFCTHDETKIVDYIEDHIGFTGYYQTERQGYVCAGCDEPLGGDPDLDRAEALEEMRLMDMLGK